MPRKRFDYEGPVGTLTEEGGFAASDVIMINDRTEAEEQERSFLDESGDQGSWWEGKSLYKIIEEFEGRLDDGDHIVDKLKITIEVVE